MQEDNTMVEEAVLGGIMLWGEAWPSEVLELEPEYFQVKKNAEAFEAMQALIRARSPVDECTVDAQLQKFGTKGRFVWLNELVEDTPTAVSLAHWSKLLVEDGLTRAARRQVKEAFDRIDGDASADDITAAVQDAIRNIKPRNEKGPVLVRDAIQPTLSQLEQEAANPETSRIAMTGLDDLDRMAELRAGQLTIIAGRPSTGKSALAGNIAERCGRDITRGSVVVFSLEMDTTSIIRRMMASRSGFDSTTLPKRAAAGELVETAEKLYNLNLYIDDRPHLSVPQVYQTLNRMQGVRLVIFDYLQLAKLDETTDRRDVKVGAITKGLKAISKDFACHVIGLSQLNRSVEQRTPPTPRLSDLRDSGNIEEDADNVWFLYHPYLYDKDQTKNVAEIRVEKQRAGKPGIARVYWDGKTQTFRNLRGES